MTLLTQGTVTILPKAETMEIHVRQLLSKSTEELTELLTGRFTVVFDDGNKLETNAAQMLYTSYIWDLLRHYPDTPVIPEHHVTYHLSKIAFGSKTTIKCYTELFRSINTTYKDRADFSRNELMRDIYRTNNNLYNNITVKTAPWYVSLDILDFKEILDNAEVRAIKANLDPTPEGIDQAQKDIVNVLLKSRTLDGSVIATGVRADILSKGQVAKCIGPCGYITDIDSYIFPKPVLRGYAEGLRSLHDSLIESRSGAKSLQFSKRPLQDTEYFSRRLQLLNMTIRNMHYTDCGSQHYIQWLVRAEEYDEDGKVSRPSDLPNLLGKYYLDEETNTLKAITAKDNHLVGQVLKLRSVMYCNHEDPYGICATCFGDLAYGIPEGANVGHLCAMTMASPVSQSVLSVKHLDGTAVVEGVYISEQNRQFLKSAEAGQSYKFVSTAKKLKPKLILSAKQSEMFSYLTGNVDVTEYHITRITALEYIQLEYYPRPPQKGEDPELVHRERINIDVSIKRRLGSFTHAFLQYVKDKGWTYDSKKNVIIDLAAWNYDEVFMTLPLKHHSMADHSREIEKLIESSKKDKAGRKASATPGNLLAELFDLVNSKVSVNMSVLEVTLYATMVVSDDNLDYTLPKERTMHQFGVAKDIMSYRSLSAAMAFENRIQILCDPINFLKQPRADHPFDAILVPEKMPVHLRTPS